MKKKIKFSNKNIGRSVKINGVEHTIDKILANKEKFRVVQGQGQVVLSYDLEDIEKVEGMVIDI